MNYVEMQKWLGVGVVMNFTTYLPKQQGWEVVVGICLRKSMTGILGSFPSGLCSEGIPQKLQAGICRRRAYSRSSVPTEWKSLKSLSSLDSQHPEWSLLAQGEPLANTH